MDAWRRMIGAQGGDPDAPLPKAAESAVVTAPASGTLVTLDALKVGLAAWRLGAGRARKEDPVSFGAGIQLQVKPGDAVRAGDVLLELRADDPARIPAARDEAVAAVTVGAERPTPTKLVLDRIA
jgi:thymidine phosphorylase